MASETRQPDAAPANEPGAAPQSLTVESNPTVRRERRDIRLAPLVALAFAVVAFALFHFWWVWRYFEDRERHEDRAKVSSFPLAPADRQTVPREPRLDPLDELSTTGEYDFRKLHLQREQRLVSFGSTDDKGFVHIPIDEAMQRIAEQTPKPNEPSGDRQKSRGLRFGGAPNSGRVYAEDRP